MQVHFFGHHGQGIQAPGFILFPVRFRLRQFHQNGVEVFGAKDASVDAEIIALALDVLRACGIEGLSVRINSILTDIIAHSGDPLYAYDYEKVIPLFGENHKLVEINNHSFDARRQNIENCKKIALCCKKHGVPIVVSSDAHFEAYVGDFGHALEMLSEIDFPEELILNASAERLNDYLSRYTHIFERRK